MLHGGSATDWEPEPMGVSPCAPPPLGRCDSQGNTPMSHKRMRDEVDKILADPPLLSKQKTLSPPRSPIRGGGEAPSGSNMCVTPMAGFVADCETQAQQIGVRWAIHQRQGPRSSQEDCAVGKVDSSCFPHAYFGVFDGHGGREVSEHCAMHLHQNVLESAYMPHDVQSALQDGFLRTDADVLRSASEAPRRKATDAGSAAVVMLVSGQELALAHAGDCRAVLVKRSGSPVPFVELTVDHSAERHPGADNFAAPGEPKRPDEVKRVEHVGASMCVGGYVCVGDHSLPMTRALGDLPLKVARGNWRDATVHEQVVTALPDVRFVAREPDDLCVVLASDGLFGNVMSSSAVAQCAREQLERTHAGSADAEMKTARVLADRALNEHHGSDNVSVVVVSLDTPRPPLPHDDCVLMSAPSTGVLADAQQQQQQQQHSLSLTASSIGLPPPPIPAPNGLKHPPLYWQGSQESVATADVVPSPGRFCLGDKLRMPFADAYPAPDGKENISAPF